MWVPRLRLLTRAVLCSDFHTDSGAFPTADTFARGRHVLVFLVIVPAAQLPPYRRLTNFLGHKTCAELLDYVTAPSVTLASSTAGLGNREEPL